MSLAAPTSLTVSSALALDVALAWTATPGATFYDVYRAQATGAGKWGPFAKVNDAPVAAVVYTDNYANSTPDPLAGGTYAYYILAQDGSQTSPPSNLASATFLDPAARVPGDFEDDIAAILATDPMADDAILTRVGFAPVNIRGWYDNDATTPVDTGSGQVRNGKPTFTCATAVVSTVRRLDKLQVAGINFTIQANHPDGTGISVLEMTLNG